jgi:thiamine biosynthesis protein ThiS
MEIQLNGEGRELSDSLSLVDLIRELGLASERIAIELNRQIIRKPDWETTVLKENDRIEIVHFVGGGSVGIGIKWSAGAPASSQH